MLARLLRTIKGKVEPIDCGMITYSDTLGELPLSANTCTELVITAGCTPDVGQHCLECVGASEPAANERTP